MSLKVIGRRCPMASNRDSHDRVTLDQTDATSSSANDWEASSLNANGVHNGDAAMRQSVLVLLLILLLPLSCFPYIRCGTESDQPGTLTLFICYIDSKCEAWSICIMVMVVMTMSMNTMNIMIMSRHVD